MNYDKIIVWRVLDHCNLSCPFCEYSKELDFQRTQENTNTILKFGHILGEYARSTKKKVLISWLGGEPFLWKDIFKVSSIFKNDGLYISATSNGTTLKNKTIIQNIVNLFSEITISIDGNGIEHDSFRNRAGLFESVYEGIRTLSTAREEIPNSMLETIRVNTILNSQSVDSVENLCHSLAEIGVDEISFNQLIGDKKSNLYSNYGLTSKHLNQLRRIKELQNTLAQTLGIRLLGSEAYIDRIISYIEDNPVPVDDCGPGNQFLFIDQFGNVGPCSFLAGDCGTHISNHQNPSDIDLIPDQFHSYIQNAKPLPCSNCMDTNVFGKFFFPSE